MWDAACPLSTWGGGLDDPVSISPTSSPSASGAAQVRSAAACRPRVRLEGGVDAPRPLSPYKSDAVGTADETTTCDPASATC